MPVGVNSDRFIMCVIMTSLKGKEISKDKYYICGITTAYLCLLSGKGEPWKK